MIEELNDLDELPPGWIRTQLGEIAEIILGQSPPSSTYNEDGKGLPFYQGKLEFGKSYPTPRKWCMAPKKIGEKGDVLISVRAPVGPTNFCPEKSCIGRGLAAIRGLGGIGTFFILYVLRAFENEIARKGTGTTFSAIGGDKLKALEIPLPPLNEQVRIVARLEELFTSLDAGVEGLRKVKAQLKRYRQAVLKYAFEGKLTEEWRKIHKDQMEPAARLLERVKLERRQGWEENLRNLGRDARKQRHKEAVSADAKTLPSLPIEWSYATADELSAQITDGEHVTPRRQENGIYLLSARNVLDGRLVLDKVDFIPNDEYERIRRRLNPEPGDVLLSCSGSVGRTCVVPEGIKFSMVRSVALLKPIRQLVSGEYMSLALRSYILQGQINRKKTQTAQANIFQGKIKTLTFPLAPFPEQGQVVNEIERRFSVADEVEKRIGQISARAGRLRQSILKKAFEGGLVPQDPTDEPAEKLLERVREERAKSEGKKDTNKERKNKPKQLELSTYVK